MEVLAVNGCCLFLLQRFMCSINGDSSRLLFPHPPPPLLAYGATARIAGVRRKHDICSEYKTLHLSSDTAMWWNEGALFVCDGAAILRGNGPLRFAGSRWLHLSQPLW
ncbi:hypothetical protein DPX16_4708 [Anabarilius grahami]|uniref:Uncharacterized protein n=1 Tax=Anabarilius grahami TaxID=495550 RepID=A0A3N0YGU0_ANAGA|nr:hypothetical protein DPX16_4708 [Anabarilius grahami]